LPSKSVYSSIQQSRTVERKVLEGSKKAVDDEPKGGGRTRKPEVREEGRKLKNGGGGGN
jgi:hypothetical protein